MKRLHLDSVLLLALVIPFIMTYRISPGDTPFWLFGLIFLGLLLYIILDILSLGKNTYYFLKRILLWFLIVIVLGSAFVSAIIVRHKTAPVYMIHDIVLQQESAIRFFLDGKNPYAVTYFGTPLEQWNYSDKEKNPALYHFVMQPFYLVFAMPFYFVSVSFLGFFDGRIPLFFLFLTLLVFADLLVKQDSENKKFTFLVLLSFNPAMLPYIIEGRSDIFMFAILFAGLFFLQKNKYVISSILVALSFAVKQSIWPLFPLYFAYLYFKIKNSKKILINVFIFLLTFSIFVLPFFFWDKKAFLDSTVFYLSGNIPNSYPISGYGFGSLLYEIGVIKDLNSYYPFYIWQIIICMPLLFGLIFFLKKNLNVKRLILCYAIFLFVYWYFSRYFNNSHLAYLSTVFITAYFWPEETN